MSKFLARKEFGRLVPADDAGEEALRKWKHGDVLTIEVKKPRNGNHHKLYWALVSLVYRNQSHYESPQVVHSALKLATGHYDLITSKSGQEYKVPKSTSFESMDQTEFSEYYDRVCDVIAQHFLPGVTASELKAEVEQMIGARAA